MSKQVFGKAERRKNLAAIRWGPRHGSCIGRRAGGRRSARLRAPRSSRGRRTGRSRGSRSSRRGRRRQPPAPRRSRSSRRRPLRHRRVPGAPRAAAAAAGPWAAGSGRRAAAGSRRGGSRRGSLQRAGAERSENGSEFAGLMFPIPISCLTLPPGRGPICHCRRVMPAAPPPLPSPDRSIPAIAHPWQWRPHTASCGRQTWPWLLWGVGPAVRKGARQALRRAVGGLCESFWWRTGAGAGLRAACAGRRGNARGRGDGRSPP